MTLYKWSLELGIPYATLKGRKRRGITGAALLAPPRSFHGMRQSRIYRVWSGMKYRCGVSSCSRFADYGGRGIRVCARWQGSFQAFYTDMGNPPTDKHTLERIDNDGDYTPENCCWATRKDQARNRRGIRNAIRITLNGRTMIASDWSSACGIKHGTLLWRLRSGWSPEKTLTTPVRGWVRK